MKIRSVSLRGFFLVGAALFFLGGLGFAAQRGWIIYGSPNSGQTNLLAGVSALSASDAWAVGYAYDQNAQQVTIVQQWDGANWNTVPSPNPGTAAFCHDSSYAGNELHSVSAISGNDVWAVGNLCSPGTGRTLTMHWDGNGWSVVSSPNKGPLDDSELVSVSALSSNDVWAVGDYQVAFQYEWETLIEHWDGTAWKIVPSPNPSDSQLTYLKGVSATALNDVWAVGYAKGGAAPLIEHYDGLTWSIVPAPYAPHSAFNGLYAVTTLSASDAWAVGYQNENNNGQNGQGLILHWDGTQWSAVESPIAGYATILLGVAASAPNDVTAVGYIQTKDVQFRPVTEHWNGTKWSVVLPSHPGRVGQLYGASGFSRSIWAVGAYSLQPMTQGYMRDPVTLIMKNH